LQWERRKLQVGWLGKSEPLSSLDSQHLLVFPRFLELVSWSRGSGMSLISIKHQTLRNFTLVNHFLFYIRWIFDSKLTLGFQNIKFRIFDSWKNKNNLDLDPSYKIFEIKTFYLISCIFLYFWTFIFIFLSSFFYILTTTF